MKEYKHTEIEIPSDNADDELSDELDMQAFIARMEAAYAHLKTKTDFLLELYKNGDNEELNAQLDDLTDAIALKNPEVQQNLAKLKQLRNSSNPDNEAINSIIENQKAKFATIRSMIVHEAGLPDEARLDAIEQASQIVATRLNDAYQGASYSSHDALTTLGIIGTNEETSRDTYHFPVELVPDSTIELWETYLAAVCVHVKVAEELAQKKSDDRHTVQEADRTRTYAHNAVTKELHSVLNLQTTDAWGYADTRHLLARIRDYVLPTRESALSPESDQLILNRFTNLEISSELSSS